VLKFDPSAGTFTTLTSMTLPRAWASVITLSSNTYLVVSGVTTNHVATPTTERGVYNTSSGTITWAFDSALPSFQFNFNGTTYNSSYTFPFSSTAGLLADGATGYYASGTDSNTNKCVPGASLPCNIDGATHTAYLYTSSHVDTDLPTATDESMDISTRALAEHPQMVGKTCVTDSDCVYGNMRCLTLGGVTSCQPDCVPYGEHGCAVKENCCPTTCQRGTSLACYHSGPGGLTSTCTCI
jgi:hypothetical protein